MLGHKTVLNYVDKTNGDEHVPDNEDACEKFQNSQISEIKIKTRKIAFKDVVSANSITSPSLSQKQSEQIQQMNADNSFQQSQYQTTMNTSFKSNECEEQEYYFNMNTSFIGRIFMFDYLKILIQLYKQMRKAHKFSYKNIPNLETQEKINYQYDVFSLIYYKRFEMKMHQNKPFSTGDMLFVLIKTHLSHFIKMAFILVFFFAIKILSSLCIRELLNAISEQKDQNEIYMWITLICISLPTVSMLDQHYGRALVIQYQSLRILLMKHIHTKVSSLSALTISQNNLGKLMNLISNDLKILETKTGEILKLPILPLPTIAAGIISYYRFGNYAFIGLAFLIACVPIQTLLGRISKKFFQKRSAISDKRMQLTNEVMESIRLIKLYAWEEAFQKILNLIRKKDLYQLLGTKIVQAIEGSISLSSGIISCFIMFYLVFQYEDPSSLTIANMFSTLDIFLFLRQEVISCSGIGITGLFEINVVMKRIVNILSIESKEMLSINQKDEKEISKSNLQMDDSQFIPVGEIALNNFSAFWKLDESVLQNITTNISSGQLVAIKGPVGSGKTSLLCCFLKEMPFYTGEIKFKGKIAYVEQEPIIFNMSLRDNIIFGQVFDQDLYNDVLEACNLNSDIEIMGGSDQFEIGEKGSNLSGGQRARVALARALYSQADIYLLDDPLSALDAKVSRQIFRSAIQKFLKTKTVLFTTHSPDFIVQADKVIILDCGYIMEQGDPNQLGQVLDEIQSPSPSPFKRSPNASPTHSLKGQLSIQELVRQRSKKETQKLIRIQKDEQTSSLQRQQTQQLCSYQQLDKSTKQKAKINQKNFTLKSIRNSLEESQENQKVTFQTYKTYFKFSQLKCLYPICILLFMANEIAYIFFTQTLGKFDGENLDQYEEHITWLGIYSFSYFAILLLKRSLLNYITNDINFQLHKQMLFVCLRSKISYFDNTPIGSIINRFSSDLSCLDTDLSKALSDSLEVVCNTLTLITTIIMLNPYFIVVSAISVVVLSFIFNLAKNVLITTKQFDLNLKSTVFTFFNTSLQGILPIKLYNQTTSFRIQFNHILDDSLRTSYTYWFTNRGFGMYIIFVAQISSVVGIFMAVLLNNDGAKLGQTITFFISLGYKLQSGLRQMIQLDVVMSSAQRAINLTELEQEPPLRTKYDQKFISERKSKRFSRISLNSYSFPSKGKIEFKNVCMSYNSEKKPVLNGVSFLIEPGKKVAFVGRTGAGKSSILQALFRMFEIQKQQPISSQQMIQQTQYISTQNQIMSEPNQISQIQKTFMNQEILETNEQSNQDGCIKIDDHQIEDIGVQTLRDGFTIIPQIPFIFTGSIRMNIDPFSKYTDQEIWNVLKEIQLEEKIKSFQSGLLTEISNSSESFTAGQRQLLCLGRAILKKSKILVLDEITSNCDAYTEDLIIQLIKKNFVDSTIITIAHRLHTIADYDKVIVLDKGKIAEQGSPDDLLAIPDGIFTNMVQCSGDKSSKLIRTLSRKKKVLFLHHLDINLPIIKD